MTNARDPRPGAERAYKATQTMVTCAIETVAGVRQRYPCLDDVQTAATVASILLEMYPKAIEQAAMAAVAIMRLEQQTKVGATDQ